MTKISTTSSFSQSTTKLFKWLTIGASTLTHNVDTNVWHPINDKESLNVGQKCNYSFLELGVEREDLPIHTFGFS